MPGIVGLITKAPRERAREELCQMVKTIRHEPFYTVGTWAHEDMGVYVGWTALPNSFSAYMPVAGENGNVHLFFSGEDFSRRGIPQVTTGSNGGTESGPSYLVDLYQSDPSFPASLDGMFHGLVVDRRGASATLFNDRYGMYRMYCHEAREGFYFAAEAKAILAVRPELRKADLRSLGEFIACSCVLQDRTLFEGIYRLPGGSIWRFRNGSLERKSTYFRAREWEEQPSLHSDAYYRELRDTVARTIPKYFGAHESIGIALTGGLDTRIIMGWQNSPAGSVSCYTFGGAFRDSHDVRLARQVAAGSGHPHTVLSVNGDFIKAFPRYAERTIYLTEGGVDLSRSPDAYVSERARQIAPIKVVGTYGSEIIRQVPMFKPLTPACGVYGPETLSSIRDAHATYAELRREHPLTFAAFRQSPWYHSGVVALEQSQLTVRSPFLSNDFVRTVYRAPRLAQTAADVRLTLIRDGNRALAQIPTDRGLGGTSGPLSGMLAHSILEFSFRSEYAYDTGMPQWLARLDHFLSPFHLERLFLGRHKFHHFRLWYRDALSGYVREMLLDSRALSRPYLQRKAVESAVLGHLKGTRNYTVDIHKLLSLELIHRLFFDAR